MDLKARATNILTRPAQEWPVIAAEPSSPADIMTNYAAPLAAIPAACTFLGVTMVGIPTPLLGSVRFGIGRSLSNAIVSWVLGLAGVYLAAVVIDRLAAMFQSKSDTIQALKLVMYSATPVWLAGVFNLVPGTLAPLGILAGLYAIYLFYLGVPVLMHTPPDRVIPYMLVAAIVTVVLFVAAGALAGAVTGVGTYRL